MFYGGTRWKRGCSEMMQKFKPKHLTQSATVKVFTERVRSVPYTVSLATLEHQNTLRTKQQTANGVL
jgi:hypothetical protein